MYENKRLNISYLYLCQKPCVWHMAYRQDDIQNMLSLLLTCNPSARMGMVTSRVPCRHVVCKWHTRLQKAQNQSSLQAPDSSYN